MAEHNEKFFENELSEKFAELDKNIRIPEIPDVQNIFDKAETEKANVIPFKKYSRYVAAAAAVVLICVSIPILSSVSSESAPQEPMEASKSFFATADAAVEAEMPMEPEMAVQESDEEPIMEEMPENEDGFTNDINQSVDGIEYSLLTSTLREFFIENAPPAKEELKDHSSAMSSSVVEEGTAKGDDLSLIELNLNKKRSIEVSVEKDSVSVILFDDSADREIITAFWVEGTFENAYKDGEKYVITLAKTISPEDLEEGFYLPMAGDPQKGNYMIPEESIVISEKITRGVIHLTVEINIGTGEYKINASLV